MSQIGFNRNNTSADVGADIMAAVLKGLIPTSGIVKVFDDLACVRVNDNLVRLSSGVYNLSGYFVLVKPGTTEDLAVDSGTPGYNRIDLVVAEFVRNGGGAGVDTLQFKIVKGTSTTGTPADPTLTANDINVEANTTRQEALYRLTITGTTLAAPELMAAVLDNLDAKAPLASPTFSGTPTAPSAAGSTDTTQIANMIAVHDAITNDLNASGNAPIYACRAWVNFNGTGTVAIRADGNVDSITDNGTGDYTVNFDVDMEDANYAVCVLSGKPGGNMGVAVRDTGTALSAGAARIVTPNLSSSLADSAEVHVAIFR